MKLFIFLIILNTVSSLFAKATCTGAVCTQIPGLFLNELNQSEIQFRTQYLDKVLDSMTRATMSTNIASSQQGIGTVNRFQVGAGVGASLTKLEEINVNFQNWGVYKLPSGGGAVAPNVMAAINLGWLFGKGGRDAYLGSKKIPEYTTVEEVAKDDGETDSILNKFSLYVHGMQLKYDMKDFKSVNINSEGVSGNISLKQYGFMLRYQVFDPTDTSWLFRFMGLSLGAGYHYHNFNADILESNKTSTRVTAGNFSGSWIADTNFIYKSESKALTADIRSGIELFNFMTAFAGAGYSRNTGDTDLRINRNGLLRLYTDPKQIQGADYLTPTEIANLQEISKKEGNLHVDIQDYKKLEWNQGYFVGGFEFQIFKMQLLLEGMAMEKTRSVNIGIKANF
ncbi:MAG: hypothetical protein SFU98_08810 [Leptospiraceae bacterium]|nr:hypothetical protein [Leptospiraceae bacterium]